MPSHPDPLREALRRIEEVERTGDPALDLSELGLGSFLRSGWDVWTALERLSGVRHLDLSDNGIDEIPTMGWRAIGRLRFLEELRLDGNEIVDIPADGWAAMGQLIQLETLVLSRNRLTTISIAGWESLAGLVRLSSLYLDQNRITHVPAEGWRALGRLKALSTLNLWQNPFAMPEEGWIALGQLRNLRILDLGWVTIDPALGAVWDALGRLTKLKTLFLIHCGLTEVPPQGWRALGRLTDLQKLSLRGNGLGNLSVDAWQELGQLSNLRRLDLSGNEISDIQPEGWGALGALNRMETLRLDINKIISVPAQVWSLLGQLPELKVLDLSANRIADIPLEGWDTLSRLPKLERLDLSDNPLPEEMLAAADRGPRSLFDYLEAARLRAAHPRTVKLLLLGEPACGKTTLVEALSGNPSPCDPNRPETIGVNVRRIKKDSPEDGRPLYLAAWDFAGQHMEYATHQFFLRAGGVYLIVWKARLGSDYGQRDLWYWLELLKMRVKDPVFLLITTHTGKTPSGINLTEIQAQYPGCQGHFEVELSDGTGLAVLEAKILELAVASPSMKAVWPAPWLSVLNEIRKMRQAQQYIPVEEFWKLCAKDEVAAPQAQRDLADQLDKLGEIVFYDREPLDRFVILDPTWVTELVAGVVRDKQVRDQGGTLNHSDLNRIWANVPADVKDHLEDLMGEYDLAYRATGPGNAASSIVVEALPPAPAEVRNTDIAGGRPQTEMIYRFPSLTRHLPPGVPTWAFARARRYMNSGDHPWRDAALFEDPDTDSQAIVLSSEMDREVRLRVASDYPPYFFGVLDGILRDTFKRYPGAQPESRIPCPCQPGCKHGHPRETVLKRKRDGKTDITCPRSGDDVPLAVLLEGVRPADTQAAMLAQLSALRRQVSALQTGQNDELIKTCPSVFTLVPAKGFKLLDTYLEYATQDEELDLTLFCEWEKEWHPTPKSVYRFRPEKEWYGSLKKNWEKFASVTKRVSPLTTFVAGVIGTPAAGIAIKEFSDTAEKLAAKAEKDPRGALSKELGLKDRPDEIDLESRHLMARLIDSLDKKQGETQPPFGGLLPYHVKEDGRLLWLCADHRQEYEKAR